MDAILSRFKDLNSAEAAALCTAAVLLAFGAVGLGLYLLHGAEAYGVYRQVPWGMHIAAYEFFVSVSAGLAILASAGVAFQLRWVERIAQRALVVALASLAGGFFVLGTEIGHPLRMLIYSVLSPNPHSALFWMGTFYGGYVAFAGLQLYFLLTGQAAKARPWALATIIVAVLALGNVGTVFGYVAARPMWHGPFLPPYVVLTALVAGLGALLLVTHFRYREEPLPETIRELFRRADSLLLLLLGTLFFFELSKVLSSLYGRYPGKHEAIMVLLSGPLALNFWVFEIILGILAPIALVLWFRGRSPLTTTAAGASALVGVFFMRYDLVVAGQLVPLRQVEAVGANGLLTYSPAAAEYLILFGALGLIVLLYFVANRLLRLDPQSAKSEGGR